MIGEKSNASVALSNAVVSHVYFKPSGMKRSSSKLRG
eukprot:CAMPEP_0115180632 /NCGR_PEP_ID=MMETSP0270-20121206/7020_1 /TAXON_ID=71861 /ORGANISM="Scrippsiella trochoidea, Strain CCMP3099" /LENGTH=36 /DNA_ID= /DNA_START= /DNA_END= /DNA_ORIENTATION=